MLGQHDRLTQCSTGSTPGATTGSASLDFRRGIESEDVAAPAEAAAKWPAFHAAWQLYEEGRPTQWELERRVDSSITTS